MAIWSTKSVNDLIKQYEKTGVMPKDNPFVEKNIELRKPGLIYELTDEELVELAKISHNILYFAENYAKVMTDDGYKIVKLRKYQKNVLLQFKKYKNNILLSSRQTGKCINISTTINIKNVTNDSEISNIKTLNDLYYESLLEKKILDRIKVKAYRILSRFEKLYHKLD